MYLVVLRQGRKEKVVGRFSTSREAAHAARDLRAQIRIMGDRSVTASVRRETRAVRNPVERPSWLRVVEGEGPRPTRRREGGPRLEALERAADPIAGISKLLDPSSRLVRTTWEGGIPLTSITLESSESPLVPEELPLNSISQAEALINWMNEHTEKEGGYDKTVIRVEWADGSVWRARFDVNGKWTTSDLFGKEHGGGITWENTTDSRKTYNRSGVLFPQTFSELIRKIQVWRRAKDKKQAEKGQSDKAKVEASLRKLGIEPGVIYHQAAYTDQTDYFHPERYVRFRFDAPSYVFEWVTSTHLESVQSSYIAPDSYWLERGEDLQALTPTKYRAFSDIPKRVYVRDLARQISGEKYPGAGVENRIIKTALQMILPKGAKISLRSSTGTGSGYSYLDVEGVSAAEKEAAFATLGVSSVFQRYYVDLPADLVPRIIAKLRKA